MNFTELKNNKLDFHLQVKITAKEFEQNVNEELQNLAKKVKIDGFRQGKVPTSMLKKKYNDSLRVDVLRDLVTKAIKDAQEERNLKIIGDPEIDDIKNEEGKDIEFTLKYSLLPDIDMPDWKNISIEKPVVELSDKDIDEQVKKLAKFSATFDKETKGKSKKGDQVTIDAIGKVDDNPFDGGKLVDHKLVLGSGVFIPGFEDQLIGSKSGDEVVVKVKFPEEYHSKSLAGKDAVFECKIKAVHQLTEPKIDDEFAKKFNFDNVDKLKEQVKENTSKSYDNPILSLMKRKLFDQLEEQLTFDLPEKLLTREKELLKQQAEQLGEEENEEIKGKSKEDQDKYYNKLAARRVRLGLLLAEYVRDAKLEITQDDINKAIIEQARSFPGQENQVFQYYSKNHQAIESLKGPVLEEKAVEDIFAHKVKLTEKKYKKDTLEKLLDE